MPPVLEPRVQCAFDQEAAKARAVDEHIALDPPLAVEVQRRDVAACPIEFDTRDLAFDALAAVGLGQFA